MLNVYRTGRLVATYPTDDANDNDVIEAMCGRSVEQTGSDTAAARSRRADRPGGRELPRRCGEEGVGSLACGRARSSVWAVSSGRVSSSSSTRSSETGATQGRSGFEVEVVRIRRPTDAIRHGMDIALVPADRKTEGLLLRRSVRENIALAALRNFSRWGVIGGARERAAVENEIDRLHIVTSGLRQPVGQAQRREPAEGRDCEMAAVRQRDLPAVRHHPRRRHRREGRDLPHRPRARRAGRGDPLLQHRSRRAAQAVPSRRRVPRRFRGNDAGEGRS